MWSEKRSHLPPHKSLMHYSCRRGLKKHRPTHTRHLCLCPQPAGQRISPKLRGHCVSPVSWPTAAGFKYTLCHRPNPRPNVMSWNHQSSTGKLPHGDWLLGETQHLNSHCRNTEAQLITKKVITDCGRFPVGITPFLWED